MAAERWLCDACGASTEPAPETPPGCPRCDAPLHVGKYGLLAELPPERSARVFRGRESLGNADVTVRLFPGELLPSLPQIRQAVKKASTLDHPTIAAPLDAGAHRTLVYVVEPWAPGEPVLGCELTLREAAGVVHDAAVALGHAEDHGVVHPDLRPENLRVRRVPGKRLGESDLRVLVTCFGIAPGGNARHNARMLGTILFTLATGRAPRESSPESPSALNPLVGSELESIILTALEANHPSARQIARDLQQYLSGGTKTPTAPALKPADAKKPSGSRIPPRAVALSAAVAAVLVALVVLVTPRRETPSEAPVAKILETPPAPPPPRKEAPPPVEPAPPAPPPKPPPEPPKPIERVPPPDPAKPAEPAKPIEPAKPAEPVKPPEPPKLPPEPPKPPPEPPKPVEPVRPPEPAKVVEAPKPAEPPKPPPEPPPAPPPPVRGSVGMVQRVHPEYGIFVRLDRGGKVAAGDVLEVVRKEESVARLKVERVTGPEKLYPDGCAICKVEQGEPERGDFVRRAAR